MSLRTDLRINYVGLEWIRHHIVTYHDAIDDVERAIKKLKNLLSDQESEAIKKLTDRVDDAILTMGNKKAALEDLGNIVEDFRAGMSELVAAESDGCTTRVSSPSVTRRLGNIKNTIDDAVSTAHWPTPRTPSFSFASDDLAEQSRRRRMERNFTRLDNHRQFMLIPRLNRIVDQLDEMFAIQSNYLALIKKEIGRFVVV